MKSPNMQTITDSVEQSLRNCSLNHHLSSAALPGFGRSSSSSSSSSSSDEPIVHEHLHLHQHNHRFDTTLELNSHVALPPCWEQCLDLKTGEVHYINCRTGMKVREDPRTREEHGQDLYSEEEEEDDSEEEPSSSSSSCTNNRKQLQKESNEDVLVVAGCKRCFMYFMVPKQVEDCPKCSSQLVHFDRSESAFP